MKNEELDETWQRLPEARVRMREDGLKTILDGLGEDGFCIASIPKIHFVDEGVYVDILLNAGKYGSVVALPLEILIPAKMPISKKKSREKTEENQSTTEQYAEEKEVAAETQEE